jgi:hypothetical protein
LADRQHVIGRAEHTAVRQQHILKASLRSPLAETGFECPSLDNVTVRVDVAEDSSVARKVLALEPAENSNLYAELKSAARLLSRLVTMFIKPNGRAFAVDHDFL